MAIGPVVAPADGPLLTVSTMSSRVPTVNIPEWLIASVRSGVAWAAAGRTAVVVQATQTTASTSSRQAVAIARAIRWDEAARTVGRRWQSGSLVAGRQNQSFNTVHHHAR